MLDNIFDKQNISLRFRNLFNSFVQKTVNQQSNRNPLEKMSQVIDSSIHEGGEKVNQIIRDTGELIRTPVKWLKDTQRICLTYIICLAIICLCVLFFYCACQGYFLRRRSTNSRLANRLAEITMTMAKNNNASGNKY
jgi:t-SNARE complex subunit (syntaxin)